MDPEQMTRQRENLDFSPACQYFAFWLGIAIAVTASRGAQCV
jgi:hypothetical protein